MPIGVSLAWYDGVGTGSQTSITDGTASSDRVLALFGYGSPKPNPVTFNGVQATVAYISGFVRYMAAACVPTGTAATVNLGTGGNYQYAAFTLTGADNDIKSFAIVNSGTSIAVPAGGCLVVVADGSGAVPVFTGGATKLGDNGGYGGNYETFAYATSDIAQNIILTTSSTSDNLYVAVFGPINGAPVNTAVPTITGTAQVGRTLTALDGTWTNSPNAFSRQWYANGTAIAGATGLTFTVTSAQLGQTITFGSTPSNAAYGSGAEQRSAATSAVTLPDWSIVGLGTLVTATSGNVALVEPAGVQQNDVLVAAIDARGAAAFTLPTGWVLVATQQVSGNTTVNTTASIASGLLAYCIRGASAPGLTFTRTGGDLGFGRIVAYRSAVSGTPTFDTGSAATAASASATATTPTITTAAAKELLVAAVFGASSVTMSGLKAATAPTTASGATDTSSPPVPDAWTERADDGTTSAADGALAVADAVKSAAAATGAFTATMSASRRHAMAVAAFAPPVAVTPPVTGRRRSLVLISS